MNEIECDGDWWLCLSSSLIDIFIMSGVGHTLIRRSNRMRDASVSGACSNMLLAQPSEQWATCGFITCTSTFWKRCVLLLTVDIYISEILQFHYRDEESVVCNVCFFFLNCSLTEFVLESYKQFNYYICAQIRRTCIKLLYARNTTTT